MKLLFSAKRTDQDHHGIIDMTAFNTDGFDVTGKLSLSCHQAVTAVMLQEGTCGYTTATSGTRMTALLSR